MLTRAEETSPVRKLTRVRGDSGARKSGARAEMYVQSWMYMRFSWDERKKSGNPRKHKAISFEVAQEVFEDPHHVILENYFLAEEGEQRMQAVGMSRNLVLLLVIFVERSANGEVIHIISARKAEAYEQGIYEKQFR